MFIANKIKQLIYKFTYMFFCQNYDHGKRKGSFFLFVKVKTKGNARYIEHIFSVKQLKSYWFLQYLLFYRILLNKVVPHVRCLIVFDMFIVDFYNIK